MAEAGTLYKGLGASLEAAVEQATKEIPPRAHWDFVVSRVVERGMQIGGFTGAKNPLRKADRGREHAFKT